MNTLETNLAEREFYPSVQEAVRRINFHYSDAKIHEIIVSYRLFANETIKDTKFNDYYELHVCCFFSVNLRSRFVRYDEWEMKGWKNKAPEELSEKVYDFYKDAVTENDRPDCVKLRDGHYIEVNPKAFKMSRIFMVDLKDYSNCGYGL